MENTNKERICEHRTTTLGERWANMFGDPCNKELINENEQFSKGLEAAKMDYDILKKDNQGLFTKIENDQVNNNNARRKLKNKIAE